ncbi:ABC transporter ATP-binding protein [Actinospica sp. MGRD01-02]|uniref:ABC transporter ATP-binding protein n=1 Tax=Actinospica acidithermotolerans TaxID=2828514 RepID=A0A941IK21_9ACTN|nr:ABC transporter ATP-binding protein [Actinospica acidithermotolerans]MBR7828477.1 ABC transporter ATP-binding protein [Actinospica acidithermotolerans]
MAYCAEPIDHHYRGEHPLRTLAYLAREDRGRLALGTVLFAVKSSPTWLLPLITANVVDVVVGHQPIFRLWINCGLMLALLLLNYPGHVLYVRCYSYAIRRISNTLRISLCRRLQELSIGYHTRVSSGVLQTKVIRDVETIEQMMQQASDGGLGALSALIGGLVVIAYRTPSFLPVIVVLVPAAAFIAMKLRAPLKQRNEDFREEVEQLSSRVLEMTSLIPITRGHGLERSAIERMDGTLRRVRSAGQSLDLTNGRFGSLSWIVLNTVGVGCLAGAAVIAYYGAFGLTAGDVVMLSAFFSTLTGATSGLLNLAPMITKGLESVRSVGEVLQAPDLESNEGKAEVEQTRGAFDFRDVSFAYPDAERPSVDHFDFSVRPGETVALVGASGAGKSTVLNLVIGFLRPTSGRIELDGVDMERLDLRTFRRFVSVVPQETILFEGTIRQNVSYGLDEVSDEAIVAALRDANALEFVEQLPAGLDTVVGERGARLSGGQKQRLAIARAVIRDPRVLILDEATSALDTRSEALIQEALARLMRGRTTFVVAHRLSTIRDADRIVVMDGGHVSQVGTHETLLNSHGAYASLHAVQAG